jgi:hypothetical protein
MAFWLEFSQILSPRIVGDGAAEGIRTPDPRITNAVLYRLSYRGTLKEYAS